MRQLSLVSLMILVVAAVVSPCGATCTPPAITVTPANPSCGSPATLDAGAGWASYHWTDAYGYDYGSAQKITTAFSGTYSVAVDDGNGCATTASVQVTVDDFSIARVPPAACPNQLIQNVEVVGPSGTPSYSWSITNGTIVNDYGRSVDLMIEGSAPAVVTATVDYGDGCVASRAATIEVGTPLTGASIHAASTTICQGSTTTITATPSGGSGSYTYVWHAYGDTINANTQTITVSPSSASWYYADVTDNYGCGQTSTPAVQVYVTPISATITAPDSACVNAVANASAPELSPAPAYSWTIDGGGTIAWGNGTSGIGFTPGANGSTLTLNVTNDGCTATSTKFVGALPAPAQPTITASGPTTFCAGGSVVLTSSPADSYLWSDGEATRSITVTATGSYWLTVKNTAGCVSSVSQSVSVTALRQPSATVSGGGTICAGSSTTVNASLSGSAPFTITWSDGYVQTVPSGNASRDVSPAATTTYTAVAMSDATGCPSQLSGSATVVVRTPPAAVVSGSTAICAGSSASLAASVSLTDYPVTVTWSDGFAQWLYSGTILTRDVTPASTTTYTITSIRDSYCSGSASGGATITVDGTPVITSQPASVTIKRNSTATLSVAATSPRPLTYQWYRGTSGDTSAPISGATTSSYTTPRLSSTTSFWVRVSSACGSTDSTTATVTVR